MTITYQILGDPGRDNALFVRVDSGQAIERLLFDCGDGCLHTLPFSEVQAIDQLFFSHLHMDHIGGFDSFFRCTFDRTNKPNHIWGPPGTARILQHRFQGFLWNLTDPMKAAWLVSDLFPGETHHTRFELGEAFARAYDAGFEPYERTFSQGIGYHIETLAMDHRTPTMAYIVHEKPHINIDTDQLEEMGLSPGPWLKQIKDPGPEDGTVMIAGEKYSLAQLRNTLVRETPGDSIAYLTDFLLDDAAFTHLVPALKGCKTMVCEGQYRHADLELAQKNYHMTTKLSASLARNAGVQELILFHLSDRYTPPVWLEMLEEARAIFPNTRYPDHWQLGGE